MMKLLFFFCNFARLDNFSRHSVFVTSGRSSMYFSLEASMKNSVQLRHEKNFPDGLLVNSNDASEKQSGHACFFMRYF